MEQAMSFGLGLFIGLVFGLVLGAMFFETILSSVRMM